MKTLFTITLVVSTAAASTLPVPDNFPRPCKINGQSCFCNGNTSPWCPNVIDVNTDLVHLQF